MDASRCISTVKLFEEANPRISGTFEKYWSLCYEVKVAVYMTGDEQSKTHRFLDEAGDTAFFGAGKVPIVGQPGVSMSFAIGMVQFNTELNSIRHQIVALQKMVIRDRYLSAIPSIAKKSNGKGFYFHATDDPPEVRAEFFRLIDSFDCSCEVMVARKVLSLFTSKHNGRDTEFYADVLSHLLKNELTSRNRLILNIAERGQSTRNANLQSALKKATDRVGDENPQRQVVFNVQNHHTEPLLNVADYMCWAVQRVFERGETRYYQFLGEKIRLVVDLYDTEKQTDRANYYGGTNRLLPTNKLSPPSP